MPNLPMIIIDHLQKVIGESVVIDIDALRVEPGEAAAVIGPAGSGKSELLSLLLGQSQPTSGSVRIAGLDPFREQELLGRQVGVLLADNGLYERLSVRENLHFHCRLRQLPATRVDHVVSLVGLADHAGVAARRLSSGLARRLAFGRTILHQPSVLVLVRPFAGCDSASTALLARLIRQMADEGTTVLILDTEIAGLPRLCRAIHRLDKGRIVSADVAEEDRRMEMPFKVPARQEGQVILVNPADILFVSAEDEQTCLHTNQGNISSHLTMAEMEKRLVRNGFFRAHRGYLVNLQRVKAVIPYTRDSFTLILDDEPNTEIPLSKTAARDLRGLLGY